MLGDSECIPADGPPRDKQVRDCERLIVNWHNHKLAKEVVEWGQIAPPGRRFPFDLENSGCIITISAEESFANDRFSVQDLTQPLFEIFLDCLLQKKKAPPGLIWMGGSVGFKGVIGHYPLVVHLETKADGQGIGTVSNNSITDHSTQVSNRRRGS